MKKFHFYSSIFTTKGYSRTAIIDTQTDEIIFIPIDSLALLEGISLNEKNKASYNIYTNLLFEKNYGFFHDSNIDSHAFEKVDLNFSTPSLINNIHIEIDSVQTNKLARIRCLIDSLKCKKLALFFFQILSEKEFEKTFNFFIESRINYMEVYIPFATWMTPKKVKRKLAIYSFVVHFNIYNSPKTYKDVSALKMVLNLSYYSGKIEYDNDDKFLPSFINHFDFYLESQNHNTYFNSTMFINKDGFIRRKHNCKIEFGNIMNIENVIDVVNTPEFQKYWFVHKGLRDVCKDCEFRHMCVDNRLPYQRKDGSWYHQIECSYNPYICKWKEEEGYQTLEEIGVVCNAEGFSIDHEKIAAINKILWEEESENA